jgi:hypothetical protein
VSLREQVAAAAEVRDADQEAAKAAQDAAQAAKAAAEVEERVREGDAKVTPAQVEKAHAESRFARLRREHAERKAARARAEVAERIRREAVDAAKATIGPDQLDVLGDAYEAAQAALAKLVGACRAYNSNLQAAYHELGQAGFGGDGSGYDRGQASGTPTPSDWSHTMVSSHVGEHGFVRIEGETYDRIYPRDLLMMLIERYGNEGRPFRTTVAAVLTQGAGKVSADEQRHLRYQLGLKG